MCFSNSNTYTWTLINRNHIQMNCKSYRLISIYANCFGWNGRCSAAHLVWNVWRNGGKWFYNLYLHMHMHIWNHFRFVLVFLPYAVYFNCNLLYIFSGLNFISFLFSESFICFLKMCYPIHWNAEASAMIWINQSEMSFKPYVMFTTMNKRIVNRTIHRFKDYDTLTRQWTIVWFFGATFYAYQVHSRASYIRLMVNFPKLHVTQHTLPFWHVQILMYFFFYYA